MNKMLLKFSAISENEAFARTAVVAFILAVNPSVEELGDVKTAVSEAVTNAVVHAYTGEVGFVTIECEIEERTLHIKITDYGKGIQNVEEALEPFWTTKGDEERSGMGFTIMKTFMNELKVSSSPNNGVVVEMTKEFA